MVIVLFNSDVCFCLCRCLFVACAAAVAVPCAVAWVLPVVVACAAAAVVVIVVYLPMLASCVIDLTVFGFVGNPTTHLRHHRHQQGEKTPRK